MKRIIQTVPYPSSNTYNATNKRIYTRFHRKPQIYPSSFQTNKTIKVQNLEQESMNNLITNIYKEKKYRYILDPAAPNNKDICIDTDSEQQKSERENSRNLHHKSNRKSTKLLISKYESQIPETYNSQNIFRRDGIVRGYYIKGNEKNTQINKNYTVYNTFTKNSRMVKTIVESPSPEHEYNYNLGAQTQIRTKKVNIKSDYVNQSYNAKTVQHDIIKKEIDLDEWPSVEKRTKQVYFRNKDIQIGDNMKTDNSNLSDNQNINQNEVQKKRLPVGMVYKKGNVTDMKVSYSKSNILDISEDFMNQYKKQQENNNFIIAGNASEIASPKDYKKNNEIAASSEEEYDNKDDILIDNEENYRNYINKKITKQEYSNRDSLSNRRNLDNYAGQDHGGKVDLYYGILYNNKDTRIRKQKIIIKKNIYITIEEEIRRDENKLNSLIKLQRFIRSYLYLRELCAMKIQAVWRGGNTRKIMDLYNDLDEFIYHLSKVQFNHFNSDFCFFINQLFNVYKANISNRNYNENDDEIDNNMNNEEEEENENENENCINQIPLEKMEQKEKNEYLYQFPEGSHFDQEKLIPENELYLFIKGNSHVEYEKIVRDYEELLYQYNKLKQRNSINIYSNINTVH